MRYEAAEAAAAAARRFLSISYMEIPFLQADSRYLQEKPLNVSRKKSNCRKIKSSACQKWSALKFAARLSSPLILIGSDCRRTLGR